MVNKDQIIGTVGKLLQFARERNTSQGVVVLEKILELLNSADSPVEVADILKKLNGALSGIEAHGELNAAGVYVGEGTQKNGGGNVGLMPQSQ